MSQLIPQYTHAGKLRKLEQTHHELKGLRMGDGNETMLVFMSDGITAPSAINLLGIIHILQDWKRALLRDLERDDHPGLQGVYQDAKDQITLLWNQRKPYSAMKMAQRGGHNMVRYHDQHPFRGGRSNPVAASLHATRDHPEYRAAVAALEDTPPPQTQPDSPRDLVPLPGAPKKRRVRPNLVCGPSPPMGRTLGWGSD